MANPNTPFGLIPRRYLSGAPYNGAVNIYSTDSGNATAIYIGDLVTLVGTGQTIDGVVYPDVVQGANGDVFQGVCVSVLPITNNSTIYREASTQRLLAVADDPNLVFEIQMKASGNLTVNDIGLNGNVTVNSGNATTGQSGMVLTSPGQATTNTFDLKITGFVNTPDNTVGESSKWFVRINRHRYVDQVAGV